MHIFCPRNLNVLYSMCVQKGHLCVTKQRTLDCTNQDIHNTYRKITPVLLANVCTRLHWQSTAQQPCYYAITNRTRNDLALLNRVKKQATTFLSRSLLSHVVVETGKGQSVWWPDYTLLWRQKICLLSQSPRPASALTQSPVQRVPRNTMTRAWSWPLSYI